MKICLVEAELFQTNMMKLIVAFHNFGHTPKM